MIDDLSRAGRLILALAPLLFFADPVAPARSAESGRPPTIVMILADDLGYGDLGCFGSKSIETPNLDSLAAAGMRLTQFYAGSAVCTPTRVSWMTGCYPLRFDCTRTHFDIDHHLPRNAVTIPKLLKQAGYTTLHVGKWNLGGTSEKLAAERAAGKASIPGPREQGFDCYCMPWEGPGVIADIERQNRYYREGAKHMVRNDRPAEPSERWLDDRLTDEALELLRQHHKLGRPLFLNLCYCLPHTPYEPAPEPHLSKYRGRAEGTDLIYRSMVSCLDANVGRVIAKLKELGLFENSLILFASDNGPSQEGSAAPFSGCKGNLYEGGIRVPAIAVWPGRIAAGSTSGQFSHTNDMLPTVCAAAGVPSSEGARIDGINLLGPLTGGKAIERSTVFWQMDRYGAFQPDASTLLPATEAARRGRWKLLARDSQPVALYDLEADPRESVNLHGRNPEIEQSLAAELRAWLAEPRRSLFEK